MRRYCRVTDDKAVIATDEITQIEAVCEQAMPNDDGVASVAKFDGQPANVIQNDPLRICTKHG